MFSIVLWVYVTLFCFKQLPLNFNLVLLPVKWIKGERLLSDVGGGLVLLSNNPIDLHSEIYFLLAINLKYLYIGGILNNFVYHLLENDFYL